jgi:CTP:molybdopterin cytidylyltransferase MocA
MIPRLKKLSGEEGGITAAKEQRERIKYVQAEPSWQGMDFDTAEDWEKVRKFVENPKIDL